VEASLQTRTRHAAKNKVKECRERGRVVEVEVEVEGKLVAWESHNLKLVQGVNGGGHSRLVRGVTPGIHRE